jgi:tRNA pseudouridine55 synthase
MGSHETDAKPMSPRAESIQQQAKSAEAGGGGVLLVDKPAGLTSHDVVARVRRILGVRRVGHAGTLDPFATGLLVLLSGRSTRLIPWLDAEPKVYEGTFTLGTATSTDDGTGEVIRTAAVPSARAVDDAIARLTGELEQVPPAVSAKQVGGVRAYAAAREGKPLNLAPVRITVHEWQVIARSEGELRARITCSGGTYVRALARDLGEFTGSAAHLSSLRRLRSGAFSVEEAVSLDSVEDGVALRSPLDGMPAVPRVQLTAEEVTRVSRGLGVRAATGHHRAALVRESGGLVAVAERVDDLWQPRVVLVDE